MARFHFSTNTPTKLELLAEWIPNQAWAPANGGRQHPIGSFHLDDPDGQVGMQTHLIEVDGIVVQVPLTYRATPLAGAEAHLVGEMQHSVLGPRYVYDAIGDPQYLLMLAAVTLTGYGQALGMVEHDGHRYAVPSEVRIAGQSLITESVPGDDFVPAGDNPLHPTFRNDRFELKLHRRPIGATDPTEGLTATWGGAVAPVVLAQAREI